MTFSQRILAGLGVTVSIILSLGSLDFAEARRLGSRTSGRATALLLALRSALTSLLLMGAASVSIAAGGSVAGEPDCARLPVSVVATPTEATLSWPWRGGAHHYWVQYSVGKFPTQVNLPPAAGQTTVELRLAGLLPGRTHVVEICEARVEDGCPAIAGQSCTTHVEVVAPLAYPGVVVADPTRATCETERGVAFAGRATGHWSDEPGAALDADDCCQQCARAAPARPYREPCLFFVFDEETQRCSLLRENLGRTPRSSAASGRVVAWPGRDDALRKP